MKILVLFAVMAFLAAVLAALFLRDCRKMGKARAGKKAGKTEERRQNVTGPG